MPKIAEPFNTVLFNQWATGHFAVGHSAFWYKSYFEKVVFEVFVCWRSPVLGRKNRLNFGEDRFLDHLFSAGKIVSTYFKTDLAGKFGSSS